MTTTITDPQHRVLSFMADFQARRGSFPTMVEIAQHFGWSSANAAQTHIDSLERKGYIERARGVARGVSMTEKGRVFLNLGLPLGPPSGALRLPVYTSATLPRT